MRLGEEMWILLTTKTIISKSFTEFNFIFFPFFPSHSLSPQGIMGFIGVAVLSAGNEYKHFGDKLIFVQCGFQRNTASRTVEGHFRNQIFTSRSHITQKRGKIS